MYFPKMPYTMRKAEQQLTRFLGLNLTENTKEGEFADAYGITTAKYPCITQRQSRAAAEGYDALSDIYEWDDRLVTVSGDVLYYGRELTEVLPGKKQIAVLNSQIVVLPDLLCIDTTDDSYRYLGGRVVTANTAGSAVFETNAIKVVANPAIKMNIKTPRYASAGLRDAADYKDTATHIVYTYGKDVDAVKACWDAEAKAWNHAALEQLCEIKSMGTMLAKYETVAELESGDIIIPQADGDYAYIPVTGKARPDGTVYGDEPFPNIENYNQSGHYAVIRSIYDGEYGLREPTYRYWYYKNVRWLFDVYNAGINNAPVTGMFKVGDYVDISGTKNGTNDKTHCKILAIDGLTNTMTFAEGSFTASSETAITIAVPFPELDFICAKGNRLWGVSNKDNTVYVSALGKPNDFYSYDTEDSYAVALGSDGDFTAICAYGDSVLCWKEDILHKFYGDMPSNYRCTDVKIAGVQKGSERSLAVIDEKLYYKGAFGVYVYSGGIPQKISYSLGDKLLTDAVGGGYRDRYYLSAKDAAGAPHLFAYDITHGLWMQEDKLYADAFARVGTALYMLSDGILYEIGVGDEKVPWMAEFVPFDETAHDQKGYTMLRLRLDMGNGAWLKVEVKEDRGPWREVFAKSATDAMTLNVPLKIGRCDRFGVRLSGKGECVIRSVEREFLIGSKR